MKTSNIPFSWYGSCGVRVPGLSLSSSEAKGNKLEIPFPTGYRGIESWDELRSVRSAVVLVVVIFFAFIYYRTPFRPFTGNGLLGFCFLFPVRCRTLLPFFPPHSHLAHRMKLYYCYVPSILMSVRRSLLVPHVPQKNPEFDDLSRSFIRNLGQRFSKPNRSISFTTERALSLGSAWECVCVYWPRTDHRSPGRFALSHDVGLAGANLSFRFSLPFFCNKFNERKSFISTNRCSGAGLVNSFHVVRNYDYCPGPKHGLELKFNGRFRACGRFFCAQNDYVPTTFRG